jgi:hypothetical protein
MGGIISLRHATTSTAASRCSRVSSGALMKGW